MQAEDMAKYVRYHLPKERTKEIFDAGRANSAASVIRCVTSLGS